MLPAARVSDYHICPQITGMVPHAGGPVLPPGAVTVAIGFLPDARILDFSMCVGPPDPIAQGSSTVLVAGLPTTRMSETTSHGGFVIMGCPTVIVGGPSVTMKVASGQSVAFVRKLQKALAKILPTRSGLEWLRQMGLNGRAVTFRETTDANGYSKPANETNAGNGTGTDSTISWNPNHRQTDPAWPGPPEIVLAHEMVHALHGANGTDANGPKDSFPGQKGSSLRNEERSTVGTSGPIQTPPTRPGGPRGTVSSPPNYSNNVPTENSFRRDLGHPRRNTYYPSNWPGGPPW